MTESEPGTKITAENSTVGIQAESVHNSNVYITQDDSPQEKYRVGVNYLNDGVPGKARDLIHEAIVRGHDGAEVRFHWALAMLSKRSERDLTTQDHERLAHLSDLLRRYPDDEWKSALSALCALLRSLRKTGADPGPALEELTALPSQQREMIVRHLDLVLTGGMKDSLWAKTREAAEHARLGNDRLNRAWAYFHPDPAKARARVPSIDTTLSDRLRTFAWSGAFVIAFGSIAWSALAAGEPLPIIALLVALAAGPIAARTSSDWYYRSTQLADKDRAFADRRGIDRPESGFAKQVDRSFQYYAHKYAPEGPDREQWLADTAGIRLSLRDEVTDLYRGDKVRVDKVNWLIRYLIADTRDQWKKGTLYDFRSRYRTSLATKLW